MELSVIIVNFNTKKLTEDCIDSIIKTTKLESYEIIVVDNSNDVNGKYILNESHKDKVKLISDVENKGFGNACNIGVKKAQGEYILLINSDILVHKNTIDKSIEYIKKDKDIGILGVRVVLKDGTLEHGCKRGFPTPSASFCYFSKLDRMFPNSKKIGAYRQTFIPDDETNAVDAVSGSFMIIKKALYEEVGGFDEDFFMYGEDLDLCYKINKIRKKIIYFADVKATHLRGQSGLTQKKPEIIFYFYDSMRIFYKKHYEKKYNPMVNKLIYKAIDIKYKMARGK